MSKLTVPAPCQGLDIYPNGKNEETFEVTIRFSASLPDLEVSIPASNNPTTASLKQHVRESLPIDLKDKRIRLIYAGKALDDGTLLSASLKRLVSKPVSRVGTPGPPELDSEHEMIGGKAKGKQVIRDPPAARIYIHCSIGDISLSIDDLAAEAKLAFTEEEESEQATESQQYGANTSTTTPAPRGFERLLNAGFTAAEILSLRQQFQSVQAHTHTPDTMPSPNTLRALEDQWLDSSNAASLSMDNQDGSAGAMNGLESEDTTRGALDDMIWGTTIGFFWPVGCLIWGVREDGIFSPRRKIAIVIGIVLNLGLGFIRWGG